MVERRTGREAEETQEADEMTHVVSLSGGTSSAVAAERVIQRYGSSAVTLWIADTLWEDEDLWRFVDECTARWQVPVVRHTDGRNPLQVAEDEHVIPNQKLAPCSKRLKIIPFTAWLKAVPKPITVHIGMDWWEGDRMNAPRKNYGAIAGVIVDFPLTWKPYEFRSYSEVVQSWGIAPPRLYGMGAPHNNCGMRCVRQGVSEWKRLLIAFPERFAEVEVWEAAQRAKGPPWDGYAIAKRETHEPDGTRTTHPLTLTEIRQQVEASPQRLFEDIPVLDDQTNCFCQNPEDFEEAA